MDQWHIVPLDGAHDRGPFSCGEPSLDRFLKEAAGQNQRKGFNRTYVLVREGENRVYGYYTLTAGQIERDRLPAKAVKKLPKYPVPVVILGRLAVDESIRRAEQGRRLLSDALNRSLAAAGTIGIFAVVVDAINEKVVGFYQRFGFKPLTDDPQRLYLPLDTVRAAVNQ